MADNENDVTQNIEVETYSAEQDVKQEAPESTDAKEEVKAEAEQPAGEPDGKEAETKKDDGVPEWAKRRFGELTKQRAEAERRAQALELELQQIRSGSQQQPTQEYQGAAHAYQQSETDTYALAQKIADTQLFNQRCDQIYESGTKEFNDFDAALGNFQMLGGLPRALVEAAEATGNPAKVIYELGKNPDEAMRIMNLPPVRMGVELAKRANASPAPKPISKAPAPISPVDGGKRMPDGLADDLDDREWIMRRQKEVEARRASR